jgi:hypothetical protein
MLVTSLMQPSLTCLSEILDPVTRVVVKASIKSARCLNFYVCVLADHSSQPVVLLSTEVRAFFIHSEDFNID